MDVSPHDIETIILDSNLQDICNPVTGDCVSVAVAIKNVFGGEYVCGYELNDDVIPVHATVEIDSTLFDGTGITYREALYETTVSGLDADDVHAQEYHIGYVNVLKNNSLYDSSTSKQVEERLRNEKERFTS